VSAFDDFDPSFQSLTGHPPFPWQRGLFREFAEGRFPSALDLPTGLGKTSVIAIWLVALAHKARSGAVPAFPRRLVYVVNRRTVVDQATRVAERMREALQSNQALAWMRTALCSLEAFESGLPLAISTLRGQFADNSEWRMDPARPALIIGTVDMIGSRLLFSGYGCGFKSRPLHAGFLGQDALLVHDEAHLEPAFQSLITSIQSEQERSRDPRRLRVLALTATARDRAGAFDLSEADRSDHTIRARIGARKGLAFIRVGDGKLLPDAVATRALDHRASGQAILIFLRKLEDLGKVTERIRKENLSVQTLTGTMRGFERDALARSNPVFARFARASSGDAEPGTVYLICTSAGEVGIDISADHMVCDLTPFDSMAQRLGRVNRFGEGDSLVDVLHGLDIGGQDRDLRGSGSARVSFDEACERTLDLLQRLPKRADGRFDASPAALGGLPPADRVAAFTPPPLIPAVNDILFDAWALTSIRGEMPGRPPVSDWLHGISAWEPPETHVAWREEVELLTGDLLQEYRPEDLLDDYPLKPHEILRDRTDRVHKELMAISERNPDIPVWLINDEGAVQVLAIRSLMEGGEFRLRQATVVLPPTSGGLRFSRSGSEGLLDGTAPFEEDQRAAYDVADVWMDEHNEPRRRRIWDEAPVPAGMRLIRAIDMRPEAAEEVEGKDPEQRSRYWLWFVRPRSADDDGSKTARSPLALEPHLAAAERFAAAVVRKMSLGEHESAAVIRAAAWHDRGKRREVWQRSILNDRYPEVVLAKPGALTRTLDLNRYRHELGSLVEIVRDPKFVQLEPEAKDLVLHLIGAHHGRSRPHFPAEESFDPENPQADAGAIAGDAPRRFGRLQQQYGRWGLAFLESLVRAADAQASQLDPSLSDQEDGR
jgi:CRISPR-associated endonuclease/helicase Cas3